MVVRLDRFQGVIFKSEKKDLKIKKNKVKRF